MTRSRGPRPFATGLVVCGIVLLVGAVVVTAVTGSGSAAGTVTACLIIAIGLLVMLTVRSRPDGSAVIGSGRAVSGRRVVLMQAAALALAATGIAVAVGGTARNAGLIGGALIAVAVIVDAWVIVAWWRGREPSASER